MSIIGIVFMVVCCQIIWAAARKEAVAMMKESKEPK